jgi:hypothetical protein
MTEHEARQVLLVRACESAAQAPWSEADAAWASREAQRALGEQAAPDLLLVRRAALACTRLAEREPELAKAWAGGARAPAAWALWLLALLLGFALDALASGGRIHLLAAPFLLIAWNLAAYAALALRLAWRLRGDGDGPPRAGPLREAFAALAQSVARRIGRWNRTPPLARFAQDWAVLGRRLHAQRLAGVLHVGAAVLAIGALGSLYLRGLVFEYRAGWDSTFVSAPQAHAILSFVFWPALQLTGETLPTVEALEALRFSRGGGENAARWIHLLALSVALFVLLPRALLAAGAGWRAFRLARRFPLPLDSPYFQGLLRPRSGKGLVVEVLPYSYHLPPQAVQGLGALLSHSLGDGVELRLADALPWGGEDELDGQAPERPVAGHPPAGLLLPLFALSATPQRDTHGVFLENLRRQRADAPLRLALIDESGLRRRYTAADAAERLPQRRSAWQRLLDDLGFAALFVDLVQPELNNAAPALREALIARDAEPRR